MFLFCNCKALSLYQDIQIVHVLYSTDNDDLRRSITNIIQLLTYVEVDKECH